MRMREGGLVVVAAVAAALGAACSSPAPATPSPADGQGAPVQPKVQRLVMGMAPPDTEANAIRDLGVTVGWQLKPMYEYLLMMDPETGKLGPGLATSWAWEPDGRHMRMQLRKGVPLHYGLGEFTAQDVVFTWKDVTHPEALYGDSPVIRAMIKDIATPNDHEVVFEVAEQPAFFTYWVSQGQGGFEIRSAKDGEARGNPTIQDKPLAGTGPYQYVSRAQGQYLRFERFGDKHWRATPDFPEFEYRLQTEASTRLAALLTGEVHVTNLPQDLLVQAERQGMQIVRGKVAGPRLFFNIYCCYIKDLEKMEGQLYPDSPLLDVRVRKALQKAINLDELNKSFFAGKGEIMVQPHLHPTRPGWNPDWEKNFKSEYGYDPEAAKRLLAEAGYGPSKPLTTNLHVINLPQFPGTADVVEAVAGYWRAVGVNPNLVNMDPVERTRRTRALAFSNDFMISGTSSVEFIGHQAYFTSVPPRGGFEDAEDDIFYTKVLRNELDDKKREALWRQLGDQVYKKHYAINLFWLPAEAVINPKVVASYVYPGNITGTWTHVENIKTAR